jgi:glucokinase
MKGTDGQVKWTFGIDVGGTNVKTAIVSEEGDIVVKQTISTHSERGFEDLVERLHAVMLESCRQANIDEAHVIGVGVGAPAFLSDDRSEIVEAVNLGWKNVPLKESMTNVFHKPVYIENDANVASLGEAWVGAGHGKSNVLCVTLGTGVGGGIVLDGELVRGANGQAGEIGHVVVKRDGPQCNCGHHGCLETLTSATAFIRMAKEMQDQGRISPDIEIAGAETVFQLATDGDAAAQEIIQEAADWLGYGLAMAANVLNPNCIVIGGGVSKAGEQLMAPVRRSFHAFTLDLVRQAATLELAQLGNDAGVIGAARLVFQPTS